MGQAQTSKTVEAQRFELKDASGKTRALLETVEDNAVLALYGPQGGKQIGIATTVGAGPSGPFLYLTRAEGKSGAELKVESGGGQQAGLRFFNLNGTSVQLNAGGAFDGLAIYGEDRAECRATGCVRAGLAMTKAGPAVSLYDEAGKERIALQMNKLLGAELVLSDPKGEPRADYTVNEEGSSLSIADPNGFRSVIGSVDLEAPRTGERHKTSAASVVLFGKDGKVLWSAP
jgi:hypothetical protein